MFLVSLRELGIGGSVTLFSTDGRRSQFLLKALRCGDRK